MMRGIGHRVVVWMLMLIGAASVLAQSAMPPVIVINRGIGGNNSQNMLARISRDVIDLKPQHVVMLVGTNDVINSQALVPIDAYERNMTAMLKRIREAGIEHVVLLNIPPVIEPIVLQRHKSHPDAGKLNEKIIQYNQKLASLSAALGVSLVDLHGLVAGTKAGADSLLRNPDNGGGSDGVHFTARGYRLLAELVAKSFENKIKAGDRVVCIGDSLTYGHPVAGGGTAFGESYPAILNNELNRMVGVASEARAFPKPRTEPPQGNLVLNGDFRDTDDGMTPIGWKLWQEPGRYEGKVSLAEGDGKTGGVRLSSVAENGVAYMLSSRFTLPERSEFEISYSARGTGKVRLIFVPCTKTGKLLDGGPQTQEAFAWQTPGDAVRAYTALYKKTPEAALASVGIQVQGEIQLTNVRVAPAERPAGASIEKFSSPVFLAANASVTPADRPVQEDARKSPNPLTLQNKRIKAQFLPPTKGGGLVSILHPSGWEFIKPAASMPLWKIQMRKLPPRDDTLRMVALTLDPEQDDGSNLKGSTADGASDEWLTLSSDAITAVRTSVDSSEPGRLVLRWEGINLPDEPAALDVTVTATLAENDAFLRFRTSLHNRSTKATAFYVASPQVQRVYPSDNKLEEDWLASPVYNGRLIRNPVANGILGKNRRFQPNRSGHSMQFDAYYHGGNGLYLGCFDGDLNAHRYELTSDAKDGLGWAVVHVPNNIARSPQQWETPYDTVITCFNGDWYDACQIYRNWALRQTWTSRGPLHQRADLPKWFAELENWVMWPMNPKVPTQLPPVVAGMAAKYNIGLWCTYWGKGHHFEGQTPERFPLDELDRHYLDHASSLKMPVMSYMQAVCWDTATPSFQAPQDYEHVVRDYEGRAVVWKLGNNPAGSIVCIIAWPGERWTQLLGDTIEQMARAGMRAAYMDSANHGGSYLNFNPKYCTQGWGGGNQYIKANQKLLEELKRRARRIDPGFCFTAESFWEGNMAQLDAYLTVNTTYQYLAGDSVTAIPMIHAVYHDYTLLYGLWVSKHDLETDGGRGYFAKMGQAFVWGVKPGWDQPGHFTTAKNHELAAEEWEHRLGAYRAARDFLVYGTLLRQPRELGQMSRVEKIQWYRGWSRDVYSITMPAVLHQAWRAPDGRVGIALYNITDEKQHMVLDIGGLEQKTAAAGNDQCHVLYGPPGTAERNGATLAIAIPPRQPVFVVLP